MLKLLLTGKSLTKIPKFSIQSISNNLRMAQSDSAFDNMAFGSNIKRVSDTEPLCHVIKYVDLGIAVSNIEVSKSFYETIGFSLVNEPKPQSSSHVTVMQNKGGLQLHLFACDEGITDDKNLLMDYPTEKYPGHTHASVFVPNVESTRNYFETVGVKITGERKHNENLKSLFSRDPDKTTWEFERNFGESEDVVITPSVIGGIQPIDHIGIRVTNPNEAIKFYSNKLGFIQMVSKYEPNPEPLKNFPPWITRTLSVIDINFIINANMFSSPNILIKDNKVRPGIVYVTYGVKNLDDAYKKLKHEGGVYIVLEKELSTSKFACLQNKILFVSDVDGSNQELGSCFMEDDDHNIIRLVQISN